MKKKLNKWLYWIPRVLSILFILFLALMSLDVFDGNYGFWGTVLGLFMHNIPSLILLVVLIMSWKREIIGGVAFVIAGLLYAARVLLSGIREGFEWYHLAWVLQISGVAFFIGIMFLIGWSRKRK
ncbi:hypothetical protein JXB28_05005 [Candidatus Woesearchaeota archaeon]|nr:hypothetical protein [Candidatus Woesearchaeota archaeon]